MMVEYFVSDDLDRFSDVEIDDVIAQAHQASTVWTEQIQEIVGEFRTIAKRLHNHHRNATIAKISGSSIGIVGGVLIILGFGLSFVTFGASLGVSIAGGVLSASG